LVCFQAFGGCKGGWNEHHWCRYWYAFLRMQLKDGFLPRNGIGNQSIFGFDRLCQIATPWYGTYFFFFFLTCWIALALLVFFFFGGDWAPGVTLFRQALYYLLVVWFLYRVSCFLPRLASGLSFFFFFNSSDW
jgi:hypothetical protein